MTTTDMPPNDTSSTPPPPAGSARLLRRSRDARVATGVCGGLGEYFGVDPVLFRVLFAVSAFFGGAGILAYLVAWAALPETGTPHAPIDGLIRELKRRRISPVAVVIGLGLLLWLVAFSWWTPGPVTPVLIVLVVLAVVLGRRELQGVPGPEATSAPVPDAPTVDLTKQTSAAPPVSPDTRALPWLDDARDWWKSANHAARLRRRRASPVKIATIAVLAGTVGILTAVGVALPVYFWTIAGIAAAGLLIGLLLRRTPWSLLGLTPFVVAGLVAFGGAHATLHDGFGTRTWTPAANPRSEYRLAFGRGVLDLRSLSAQSQPRTVRVTAGAGQVQVLLPANGNVRVVANVHIGAIVVRGSGTTDGGVSLRRVIPAPVGSTGARTTVDVHLADGQVQVVRG